MNKGIFTQRRSMAGLCLLMLAMSLLPVAWAGVVSTPPRHFLETLLAPMSHPVRSLALRFVGPKPPEHHETMEGLRRQRDEYHRLAYKLQLELDQLQAQNQQLSQIGRMFKGFTGLSFVSAQVVASRTVTGQLVLRINRGLRDGLGVNNVVTDGINLVGRIVDVGPASATVQTITSPGMNLMVRFAPAGPQSPRQTKALLEVAPDGRGLVGVVDVNQTVREGDIAFLADNQWPRDGFVVGQVVSVEVSPTDLLRQIVRVDPQTPLWSLQDVTVVVPQLAVQESNAH